jgi:hypothetical protein
MLGLRAQWREIESRLARSPNASVCWISGAALQAAMGLAEMLGDRLFLLGLDRSDHPRQPATYHHGFVPQA